jgi:hypothetical protein
MLDVKNAIVWIDIDLAQNSTWRARVKTEMNFHVKQNWGNFLSSYTSSGPLKRARFHVKSLLYRGNSTFNTPASSLATCSHNTTLYSGIVPTL